VTAALLLPLAVWFSACGGGQAWTPADQTRIRQLRAETFRKRGDLVRALELRQAIMQDARDRYGEFSEQRAAALHELGLAYLDLSDVTYGTAALLLELQAREKLTGPDDVSLAPALDELGRAYLDRGDITQASQSLQRSMSIRIKKLGSDTPQQAATALYLGRVALRTGQADMAEALIGIAQRYYNATEGPAGPHAAALLAGLAACAVDLQQYPKAGPLWDQAIATAERIAGTNSEEVAEYLTERADLYIITAAFAQAPPLLMRAEGILARSSNPKSARMARMLEVGGKELFIGRGDLVHSLDLFQRSLKLTEQRTATNSSYTASVLELLTEVNWAKNDLPAAVSSLEHLEAVSEDVIANAANAFSRGTDEVRIRPLSVLDWQKDFAVSLSLLSGTDAARKLALVTLLRRKGRQQELLSNELRVARDRAKPETRNDLHAYLDASRQYWHTSFGALIDGGAPRGADASLRYAKQAEAALTRVLGVREGDEKATNEAMMSASENVSIERVASGLSKDGALVEFSRFRPYDWRKVSSHEPRYVAMVLWPDGRIAQADLGEAQPIEELVKRLRGALTNPAQDARPLARQLDERVMRPVRALLGDTRRLIVASDAALSLVPFGALVDELGDYLVKNWYLVSLTTGRELTILLRPRTSPPSAPLVLADPNFGPRADNGGGARGLDIKVLRRARFSQLPGTAEEGKAIASLLRADLVTGDRATRQFLASRHAPSILHIATHGFFLEDSQVAASGARGLVLDSPPASAAPVDALYRSGLVFAGANQPSPDLDSILTAREALALDLDGTELVVLSACETGVGEISTGQGVRGLQQAFMTAGARSLVMSLWKVDDTATSQLMKGFYSSLTQGHGPAVALRTAQLRLLAEPAHAHPYYWASFVQYGDPSPLKSLAAGVGPH
jgi:CHAT domain-containing protein